MPRTPADPWPFGTAIKTARGTRSTRSVAAIAGISEGRWRQLEAGTLSAGRGHQVPARPKPATAAAMARAVGLDVPVALRLAGFDPAEHPELMPAPAPAPPPPAAGPDDLPVALAELAAAIARVQALLARRG